MSSRPPRVAASERLHVLVLFGGRSAEHEVSCLSAASVVGALDPGRFAVTTVGITRRGRWTLSAVPTAEPPALPSVSDEGDTVMLMQTRKGPRLVRLLDQLGAEDVGPVDVCFPVLHGPWGEDGTVQGLLASVGVPYVGADVASSAVGIDKAKMKHVFTAQGLPQVAYEVVRRAQWEGRRERVLDDLAGALDWPVFTKPARQGSSVGISRCDDRDVLAAGLEEAFTFDRVAIAEQGVPGARELECGVIGNTDLLVTRPGETVHTGAFYDYEAKYLAPVELRCPADVPDDVLDRCVTYAREAFHAIGCRGMARVDFFYLQESGEVLVNELNTIPGMTPASMLPPVLAAEGLAWPRAVERLLELALDAARTDARYAP